VHPAMVSQSSEEPRIWESFLWGLLSATSLNIGSVIGVSCLPRRKLRAVLMSFGGGALLYALSIELFGHVLHTAEKDDDNTAVWIMEISAIAGGVFFAMLNRALNNNGAALRKFSTTKNHLKRLRSMLLGGLAVRLGKIRFFESLTCEEVQDLIQSAMYKERFGAGDIIMSSETRDNGIFFVISGMVRVHVSNESMHPESNSEPALPVQGTPSANPANILRMRSKERRDDTAEVPKNVKESLLHTWDLGPDKIFGDMAVLTGQHRAVTVIALETTKLLVLPGHEVARLIDHPKVRDQVAARSVNLLRGIDKCRQLPAQALSSLAELCAVVTYQPGEVIYDGFVDERTAIMSIIHGAVEVVKGDGSRTTIHASNLLCAEHLRGLGAPHFVICALETTTVLVIERDDLDQVFAGQHASDSPTLKVPAKNPVGAWVSVPCAVQEASKLHLNVPNSRALPGQVFPEPDLKSRLKTGGLLPLEIERFDKGANHGPGSSKTSLEVGGTELATLGQTMGWDSEESTAAEDTPQDHASRAWQNIDGLEALVTDQDLEEREQDLVDLNATSRQHPSFLSSMMNVALPTSPAGLKAAVAAGSLPSHFDTEGAAIRSTKTHSEASADGSDLASNRSPPANSSHPATTSGDSVHAAIMVWLGILIDAVPESLVIGILINKSSTEGNGSSSSTALPFVIGVFLSNLPESMSSSGSMKAHGMRVRTILMMWLTITFLTAFGAMCGALLFPPGSSKDPSTKYIVSSVEGLAAGAMLTMIAQTMMPEAFEQGGDVVGLSCLAGFLCSLSVKLIPSKH